MLCFVYGEHKTGGNLCSKNSKLISPAITVDRFPMITKGKDALLIYAPGSGYRIIGEIHSMSHTPYPKAHGFGNEVFMYQDWVHVHGEGSKKVYILACPSEDIRWRGRKLLREYKI